MEREDWLLEATTGLLPLLLDAGLVLPPVILLVSNPEYTPKTSRAETWVEGGIAYVRLSPRLTDTDEVLRVLAHELIHACVGPENMHGRHYREAAQQVGFIPPWTATNASAKLQKALGELALVLGPYPV